MEAFLVKFVFLIFKGKNSLDLYCYLKKKRKENKKMESSVGLPVILSFFFVHSKQFLLYVLCFGEWLN